MSGRLVFWFGKIFAVGRVGVYWLEKSVMVVREGVIVVRDYAFWIPEYFCCGSGRFTINIHEIITLARASFMCLCSLTVLLYGGGISQLPL